MTIQTESRQALRELIDLLSEVDERWASPEWRLTSEADVVGAHRALMHILEGGLGGVFESDPSRPDFRRIVSPSRKFTGDNPDAIYYDAPISGDREYIVRGNHGRRRLHLHHAGGGKRGRLDAEPDGRRHQRYAARHRG